MQCVVVRSPRTTAVCCIIIISLLTALCAALPAARDPHQQRRDPHQQRRDPHQQRRGLETTKSLEEPLVHKSGGERHGDPQLAPDHRHRDHPQLAPRETSPDLQHTGSPGHRADDSPGHQIPTDSSNRLPGSPEHKTPTDSSSNRLPGSPRHKTRSPGGHKTTTDPSPGLAWALPASSRRLKPTKRVRRHAGKSRGGGGVGGWNHHHHHHHQHPQLMRVGCVLGTCQVQNLSHRLYQLIGQSGREDHSPINPRSPHSYG